MINDIKGGEELVELEKFVKLFQLDYLDLIIEQITEVKSSKKYL
jgi:hypothetical protein